MTKAIINMIKKSDNAREKYGIASGIVGIICNVLLCIFKFIIGSLSGSISITADALNNLSDTASNGVTIIGTKLSNRPVDREHPFGHGRIEYISALIVSGLIFVMGFELAKSSVEKIIHPEELKFSIVYIVVLGVAILAKLWLAYFNHRLYLETNNLNLKTVKQDSLNDCISTLATIIALVVTHVFGLKWFDGAIGLGVAVVILLSGLEIIKDIIGPLLGQAPEKELVEEIERIITAPDLVIGVHDLIVHDYGPGRKFASAHAEVPSNEDIMELHDIIDIIEYQILQQLNIVISIHMDPIVVDDEEVSRYREIAREIISSYNSEYSFHDFRAVKGPTHTNLIFDLIIPFEDKSRKGEIYNDLRECFKAREPKFELVINMEHSYV